MFENVKAEIKDIISIVKECPENLQEKCFDVLLSSLLKDDRTQKKENDEPESKTKAPKSTAFEKVEEDVKDKDEDDSQSGNDSEEGDEILPKDFHIKTRKFIEHHSLSYKVINKLYYKENDDIKPLYDNLGTTQTSKSQIRLALLSAFEGSFKEGEMIFNTDTVKERCRILKCLDMGNFGKNFNNNANLFDGFEKYQKAEDLKLSTQGKKELASTLTLLADAG